MTEALLTREAAVDLAEVINVYYGLNWTPEHVISIANRYYDEGLDETVAEAVVLIAHHEHLVSQQPDG